jgi:monoamine oxidase
MDLRTLDLHPSAKDAIRCLRYDDSVKIALKFSYPWWIKDANITRGGAANTDLPIRVCVYPSYNVNDPLDKPAVLLASYTWSQDASRIGSLVAQGAAGKQELLDVVLRDLGRLHAENGVTEAQIRAAYAGEYHAWSWTHDRFTSGAFALFGPGQFRHLYPYLVRPAADAKFHIVGEAASGHHAWVIGSLDSAWMAVYKFLRRYDMWYYISKLEERWGTVSELQTGPKGFAHLLCGLGTLKKGEHVCV